MEIAASDDDELFTVPVYLSQELARSLYLVQYPLRPAERPYDDDLGVLTEARIKPEHNKVEFVYRLDAHSDNYNEEAENSTESVTLGSRSVPPKTNYAIGMLRSSGDDEQAGLQLHLTPLHAVVQMRPELTHIDAADAQRRQDEAAARDGPDDGAAQAVKPISVLYRKVDSDRVADIKRSSFAHLQDKLEREKWSQLKILPRRSLEAQDTFERLISESCEPVPFEYNLPQLMEICNPPVPDPNRTLSTISRATAAFMTHDHLRSMELAPQLLALLTNCPVIQFKQICDLNGIPSVEGGLAVVDELQSIAYCVQGCWVLKSHIYHTSQIELARDWLLTSFARSRTVSRRQFTERSRLSIETTEVLLEEFAVKVPQHDSNAAEDVWELKMPTDTVFMQLFPEVVAQQNALLAQLEQHVTEQLKQLRAALSSVAGDDDASAMPAELTPALVETHLHQFVETVFQKNGTGVCSIAHVLQYLASKRRVSEKSSWLHLVGDAAVEAHVRQRYFQIRPNVYVRHNLNNPLIDRFRSVLVQHLAETSAKVLKKVEVFALFAAHVRDASPSEADYNRIMKELCVYTGSGWSLKSGEYEE